jgi:hypothetical protein
MCSGPYDLPCIVATRSLDRVPLNRVEHPPDSCSRLDPAWSDPVALWCPRRGPIGVAREIAFLWTNMRSETCFRELPARIFRIRARFPAVRNAPFSNFRLALVLLGDILQRCHLVVYLHNSVDGDLQTRPT